MMWVNLIFFYTERSLLAEVALATAPVALALVGMPPSMSVKHWLDTLTVDGGGRTTLPFFPPSTACTVPLAAATLTNWYTAEAEIETTEKRPPGVEALRPTCCNACVGRSAATGACEQCLC